MNQQVMPARYDETDGHTAPMMATRQAAGSVWAGVEGDHLARDVYTLPGHYGPVFVC